MVMQESDASSSSFLPTRLPSPPERELHLDSPSSHSPTSLMIETQPRVSPSILEDEIRQGYVLEDGFKEPLQPQLQIIKLEPHIPEPRPVPRISTRRKGKKVLRTPSRGTMASSRSRRSPSSSMVGTPSDFGDLSIPDTTFPHYDPTASPFPSTSSNSPQHDPERLSPLDAAELEESRSRSRRNEANSRNRLQEAENRLRSAIYERQKQIPSSKHRVSSMAADIIEDDTRELIRLTERVRELERTCQRLEAQNRDLQVMNRNFEAEFMKVQAASLPSVPFEPWHPVPGPPITVPSQPQAPRFQGSQMNHPMPHWSPSGC